MQNFTERKTSSDFGFNHSDFSTEMTLIRVNCFSLREVQFSAVCFDLEIVKKKQRSKKRII